MKRNLFESTKAIPYTPGDVVDRFAALSAVLGILLTAAPAKVTAKITVTHCDTVDGIFEPVLDERLFMNDSVALKDGNNKVTEVNTSVTGVQGDLINVDIDLVGCKQYIKVAATFEDPTGITAGYVLSLGDFDTNPVG